MKGTFIQIKDNILWIFVFYCVAKSMSFVLSVIHALALSGIVIECSHTLRVPFHVYKCSEDTLLQKKTSVYLLY